MTNAESLKSMSDARCAEIVKNHKRYDRVLRSSMHAQRDSSLHDLNSLFNSLKGQFFQREKSTKEIREAPPQVDTRMSGYKSPQRSKKTLPDQGLNGTQLIIPRSA